MDRPRHADARRGGAVLTAARAPSTLRRGVVAWLALALVAAACAPSPLRRSLGARCTDSCDGDLACELGRCRIPCESGLDCGGLSCVKGATRSVCTLNDESGCSADKPCPTGLTCTKGGICASGCGSGCLPQQTCVENACLSTASSGTGGSGGASGGSGGGSGASGGAAPLPGTTCDDAGDCGGGEICSKFSDTTYRWACQPPNATGKGLGESCTDGGECKSAGCDPYAATCAIACQTNADCGSGNLCARRFYEILDWSWKTCLKACSRDADCPPSHGLSVCAFRPDGEADKWINVCTWAGAPGDPLGNGGKVRGFGETVAAGDNCYSGMTLGGKCTRSCATSADCAAPYPTCGTVSGASPSGAATNTLTLCRP